jgi:hypothetical protein
MKKKTIICDECNLEICDELDLGISDKSHMFVKKQVPVSGGFSDILRTTFHFCNPFCMVEYFKKDIEGGKLEMNMKKSNGTR